MSEGTPDWLGPVATVFTGAVTAFLLWLGNRLVGKAAFQTALNEGFSGLAQELREERDGFKEELRLAKQEIKQLRAALSSMEHIIRRHGMIPPHVVGSLDDIILLGEPENADDTK